MRTRRMGNPGAQVLGVLWAIEREIAARFGAHECRSCRGHDEAQWQAFRRRTSTGYAIVVKCSRCNGYPYGGNVFLPRPAVYIQHLLQDEVENKDTVCPVCHVCGQDGVTETHHLAPWAQFGEEAARWPTVDVCRTCHERWHARMGQPISRMVDALPTGIVDRGDPP